MCVSFVGVFRVAITHRCMISHMAELSYTCDFSVCGPFRSERSGKKNTRCRSTRPRLLLVRSLQGPVLLYPVALVLLYPVAPVLLYPVAPVLPWGPRAALLRGATTTVEPDCCPEGL